MFGVRVFTVVILAAVGVAIVQFVTPNRNNRWLSYGQQTVIVGIGMHISHAMEICAMFGVLFSTIAQQTVGIQIHICQKTGVAGEEYHDY